MKWIYATIFAACGALPALACNSEMLAVQDWQAAANPGNRVIPVRLEATVQYQGDQPYRMIHAGVLLSDALGGALGQVNLERDENVAPGDVVEARGFVQADERLLTINRADVKATTCVWSVVYADGTVEKFE